MLQTLNISNRFYNNTSLTLTDIVLFEFSLSGFLVRFLKRACEGHLYKECLVLLPNRGGISQSTLLEDAGLGSYKWYRSQTSDGVPARTMSLERGWTPGSVSARMLSFERGGQQVEYQWERWAPVYREIPKKRGTSTSKDAGPWREVDCEIPHLLKRVAKYS